MSDYRDQHLTAEPPLLATPNPRLRALVSTMLRKLPASRPSAARVTSVLEAISKDEIQGGGFKELALAGAARAEAELRADAEQSTHGSQRQMRKELAVHAFSVLQTIADTFYERIQTVVMHSERIDSRSKSELLHVKFGDAILQIEVFFGGEPIPKGSFPESGWDVIAGASIVAAQTGNRRYVWGASLWYTNLGQGEEYRWWEVMYMSHRLIHSLKDEPFASDNLSDADLAASPVEARVALASKPRPIDDENIDDFCDRWASLFAKAYQGGLEHPRKLPLD